MINHHWQVTARNLPRIKLPESTVRYCLGEVEASRAIRARRELQADSYF